MICTPKVGQTFGVHIIFGSHFVVIPFKRCVFDRLGVYALHCSKSARSPRCVEADTSVCKAKRR